MYVWLIRIAYWKAETLSSGHVWMWELDCEESWAPKNWCFWTVVLEKTRESPLGCKEIQPVHPKGDQSWVFIERTDVEAQTPIRWPPDAKSWLIGKDPDAGKDWGQEEKGVTEDEMVGWHHWLNGHGFGWTPGVGDGQGGLACCDSWGRRIGHDWVTELNWIELKPPEISTSFTYKYWYKIKCVCFSPVTPSSVSLIHSPDSESKSIEEKIFLLWKRKIIKTTVLC